MLTALSSGFAVAVLLVVALKLWLAQRQVAAVGAHSDRVPAPFDTVIPLQAHQLAAAYTIAKQRLGMAQTLLGAAVLLGLTLLGGLQRLGDLVAGVAGRGLPGQVALVACVGVLLSAIDVPLDAYRQFRLEQRFGFNRMTPRLFIVDHLKGLLVAAVLGLPLLACILWLMARSGEAWWLYAWIVWVGFGLLLQVLYPTVIAPLFNRFTPLADATLMGRIDGLLARTGFRSRGVFTIDGSRRSSHGNAYFAGLGRSKRIVFFDTLLARLEAPEIEAVLAHELGHFRLHHIVKRLLFSMAASLAGLATLGWLARQAWFYEALGVVPRMDARNDAVALLLFALAAPVFTFVLAPFASLLSRRHEFEADAFASRHASSASLVSALTKLYRDNASTLTPDPLHSAFYDSHPPAALRIARLVDSAGAAPA
ncbi:MAG TPA: M48 family metallopeptidase [Burkholderiaceae bacterium]|nr:M48 family metallopeptidase [Burkholderiaceae bacterium]